MGSTIYNTIYSVIKENNNCYWSAILTLDKAALEAALPLYTEWRASSLPEPEPVRPCRVRDNFDLKRDTHILWPVDCNTSRSTSTSTSTSAVHNLWQACETCDSWWPGENTKQNVSRCVCACVCGGIFVIVLPCHRSEWAVLALCLSERERTTVSGSGRGTGRASARRVFVEFLFWHLTEDAAATPMRRLSDKICCCCSSLLYPPSLT